MWKFKLNKKVGHRSSWIMSFLLCVSFYILVAITRLQRYILGCVCVCCEFFSGLAVCRMQSAADAAAAAKRATFIRDCWAVEKGKSLTKDMVALMLSHTRLASEAATTEKWQCAVCIYCNTLGLSIRVFRCYWNRDKRDTTDNIVEPILL